MKYAFDKSIFQQTYLKSDGTFKFATTDLEIFPYLTTSSKEGILLSTSALLGNYVSFFCDEKYDAVNFETLIEKIRTSDNLSIDKNDKELSSLFSKILKSVFFDENGVRTLNLPLLQYSRNKDKGPTAKVGKFLAESLADPEKVKTILKKNIQSQEAELNVLERFVCSKINELSQTNKKTDEQPKYRYPRYYLGLEESFLQDFEYIVSSRQRTRQYLSKLLNFYYFMYFVQLMRFLASQVDGDRNIIIPHYFALDWESTSQSRKCYTEGWKSIEKELEKLFIHKNTIAFLNQIKDSNEILDYKAIHDLATTHEESVEIASEIRQISDTFREILGKEDESLEPVENAFDPIKTEISNLHKLVTYGIREWGNRGSVELRYKNQFSGFAERNFLKPRGRSGNMLNMTEENLILMTKLAIKDKPTLRLKDVFKEFELRGVFFDSQSKEAINQYYEKLNLIEKKSDSGDAQYVKRIL